jgi:transcriptional regulator with XRE-family HTH domain
MHSGRVLIADTIRLRREELGLAQGAVATAVSVTQQTVSRWERGLDVPPASRMRSLADVLQLRTDHLLRLGGYLPDDERSPVHEAFQAVLQGIVKMSDAELLLLIDAAWQTYRERQGLRLPPEA